MPKVALFLTCTADLLYPSAGRACVRVLEALGVEVSFPEAQSCCGQPWRNSGHPRDAMRVARHFLATFEAAPAVVAPSSSCVDTIRNGYPELFAALPSEQERFQSLASRTWEFCEYLDRVLRVAGLPRHPEPRRTTYHASCRTLRGVGLRGVAERYLSTTLGDAFVPLPDSQSCCGFGGGFSVKFPEVSGKLLDAKLQSIESTGAEVVASLDLSCLTHLSAGARRRNSSALQFKHVAQILEDAFGGGAE